MTYRTKNYVVDAFEGTSASAFPDRDLLARDGFNVEVDKHPFKFVKFYDSIVGEYMYVEEHDVVVLFSDGNQLILPRVIFDTFFVRVEAK